MCLNGSNGRFFELRMICEVQIIVGTQRNDLFSIDRASRCAWAMKYSKLPIEVVLHKLFILLLQEDSRTSHGSHDKLVIDNCLSTLESKRIQGELRLWCKKPHALDSSRRFVRGHLAITANEVLQAASKIIKSRPTSTNALDFGHRHTRRDIGRRNGRSPVPGRCWN
jgi:hypothetical protein